MKKLLFLFLNLNFFILHAQPYVTMDGCTNGFKLGNNTYNMLSCSYIVQPTKNCETGEYYLSPNWHYSSNWTVDCNATRPTFGSPSNCLNIIDSDLNKIVAMGFSTVRLNGLQPYYAFVNGKYVLQPVTGNWNTDFLLLDQMLTMINSKGLKALLLTMPVKAPTTPSGAPAASSDQNTELNVKEFTEYLQKLSSHINTSSSSVKNGIAAYDICNESITHFQSKNQFDKFKIAGWVNEWYYTIKRNDPDHLVMIGLINSFGSARSWEPEIMNVDLIGNHVYASTYDISMTQDFYALQLSWLKDNSKRPFIVGETSFSGDFSNNWYTSGGDPAYLRVGTEANQHQFAQFSLQRTLDCNCKGYNWWQYRNIQWGNTDNWEQNYFGLRTYYPQDLPKLASQDFLPYANFGSHSSTPSNCTRPSGYSNLYNLPNQSDDIFGIVKDGFSGTFLNDAVIYGLKYNGTNYSWHWTLPYDTQGNFRLRSTQSSGVWEQLWISLPGYSTIFRYNGGSSPNNNIPSSSNIYYLNKIVNNQWIKAWTNNNALDESVRTNKLATDWNISTNDKYVVGDFDADGRQELFVINNTSSSNDRAELIKWSDGDYASNWSNSGFNGIWNNGNSDWIYTSGTQHWWIQAIDKFIAGNFDGLPGDELLCVQNTSGVGDWAILLKFNNSIMGWDFLFSNQGNDWIGPWWLQGIDYFYVGNFDGVKTNGDELLCLQKTYGMDWASFLRFQNGSFTFAIQSPYYTSTNGGNDFLGSWQIGANDLFYIGNFNGDSDGMDDILATQNSGRSQDWMTLQTSVTNNQYLYNLWTNSGSSSPSIYSYRDKLLIGNFDGRDFDGSFNNFADEILCFNTSNATALKFSFTGGEFVNDWDATQKISDWSIIPEDGTTSNFLFVGPYSNAPQNLLAFNKQNSTNLYRVNMYFNSNHEECPNYGRYSDLQEINNLNVNEQNVCGFNLYPNPTEKEFTISLKNSDKFSIDNMEMVVFNIMGNIVLHEQLISNSHSFNFKTDLKSGLYFVKIFNNNILLGTEKLIILK